MHMLKKLTIRERKHLSLGLSLINTNREVETIPSFLTDYKEKTGGTIIYMCATGSILHGTNSENSDTDYKGIYIPSMQEFVLDRVTPVISMSTKLIGKNSNEDIDVELYSIFEFFRLCSSLEANSLEILFSMFSEHIKHKTEESELIKENYKIFLSNRVEKLIGFAMSMANRYTIKGERVMELERLIKVIDSSQVTFTRKEKQKRTLLDIGIQDLVDKENFEHIEIIKGIGANYKEELFLTIFDKRYPLTFKSDYVLKGLASQNMNYGKRVQELKVTGIDYKSIAHAFRAIWQAKELLQTGFIKFPLLYADELKRIKFSKTLTKEYLSDYLEEEYFDLMRIKEEKNYSFIEEDDQANKLALLKVKIFEVNTIKKDV